VRTTLGVTAFVVSIGLIACGGEAPPPAAPSGAAASAGLAPNATFAEQATEGGKIYVAHCASCHGSSGEGSKDAPRVVGLSQGALPLDPPAGAKYRKNQFHTAADVASFVVKNMPADAPGSLSEAQYFAVLAFDLKANGVDLGAKHMDGAAAAAVTIHP
jgi:cytochrome c